MARSCDDDFFRHSPPSPFGSALFMFARWEYQKGLGNLSHIHLIIEVDYSKLNSEQTNFVDDLIFTTITENVRSEDVQKMIEDKIFQNIDSVFNMQKMLRNFFLILVMKDVRFVQVLMNAYVESGTIDWKPKTILKKSRRNFLMICHNIVKIN